MRLLLAIGIVYVVMAFLSIAFFLWSCRPRERGDIMYSMGSSVIWPISVVLFVIEGCKQPKEQEEESLLYQEIKDTTRSWSRVAKSPRSEVNQYNTMVRGSTRDNSTKMCFACDEIVDDKAPVCPKCDGHSFLRFAINETSVNKKENLDYHLVRAAEMYAFKHSFESILKEFQRAILRTPYDSTPYVLLGHILVEKKRYKDAIPWLEKAVTLHRNRQNHQKATQLLETARAASEKGCFIATVCYSSDKCEQLQILRRYRDEKLMKSFWGTVLVHVYYKCSPFLASRLHHYPRMTERIRRHFLDPLVHRLHSSRHEANDEL